MSVAEIAETYFNQGFHPLPLNGKKLTRKGVSGNAKKNLSLQSIRKFSDSDNLGLRMSKTMIGIDFDAYKGEKDFLDLIDLLGDLPETYRSTSRTDVNSGIYFYTIPFGAKFISEIPGAHVELIQHTHRYATVYPSIHPDTNAQYRWYFGAPGAGNSILLDQYTTPDVADIPELPARWVDFLAQMNVIRSTGTVSSFKSKECSFAARVAKFANMNAGDRNNVMKDLARDGRWYELSDQLEEGQSLEMILAAAHDNGLVSEDTETTVLYRINFSRVWAEKHYDVTKVGNVSGATTFDETQMMDWNSSVQASALSNELKVAAAAIAAYSIENEFGYVLMTTRGLAEVTGVSHVSAHRYMKKLEAKGWIKLTAGQSSYEKGKTARATRIDFLFELVTESPVAEIDTEAAEVLAEYFSARKTEKEKSQTIVTSPDTDTTSESVLIATQMVEVAEINKLEVKIPKPRVRASDKTIASYEEGASWLAALLTKGN